MIWIIVIGFMIIGGIVKLGISLRECKAYAIAEYEAKKQKEKENTKKGVSDALSNI